MEKFINEIIELDEKTLKLNEEFEDKIVNSETDLKKNMKDLEDTISKETQVFIKEKTDELLAEGKSEVETIRKENKDRIDKMTQVFEKERHQLVDNFFEKLVKEGKW